MEQVNIKEVKLQDGTTVLEVRSGDLPKPLPLHEPVLVKLEGNIDAPELYLSSRRELITNDIAKRSHVLVDTDKGSITLVVDETNHFAQKVTGALSPFPYLKAFGINNDQVRYTVASLIEKVKMMRFYFPDKDQNVQIILGLQKFSAKVTKTIDDHNDQRGNTRKLQDTILDTDFNFSFKLCMPIFKGGEKVTFLVDICPDVTDAGIKFLLTSPELFELEEEQKEIELDKALTMATELGITIIYK